jgi:serine/threonine protein kinase
MGLQSGAIVDRYRLEERLGVGAFGEVWKASQLADGKEIGVTCAVKLMKVPQDRGASPRSVASSWLDEARSLVRVAGDTIPRIYEANVWHEYAYIAMELLDGVTLATRLAQGPIPWRRALFIATQIAKALDAAHRVGIVHRDLKPQNIILVGSSRVCVVDWGIARLKTSTAPAVPDLRNVSATDVKITDVRQIVPAMNPHLKVTVIGTPGYMAPEVYEGAPAGPEQDVYALGVVLYEMVAGRLPHAIELINHYNANVEAMKAYRTSLDKATMDYSMVSLRRRCPGVPSGVAWLVDSLLAREPERRRRGLCEAFEQANTFPNGVPYPPFAGLLSLGPEYAGLYFGQQNTVQHILERLKTQRGALLWGPSGSGKSSLALAGVAATMDRTLFLGMDGWDIHVIRPREGRGLRVISETTPAKSGRAGLGQLVVIDSLEEVVDLESQDQDAFCAAILALLQRSSSVLVRDTVVTVSHEVRVIATIRDDLEWRVDREVPVLRPLLESRIIVTGVDANFARRIIEEPARAMSYEVEGIEAVSREVEERLSSEPASLPVVQYALAEWWERRDEEHRILPASAWKGFGGVDGALSFVAERFFLALDSTQKSCVEALFLQLFESGRKKPLPESVLNLDERGLMEQLIRLRLVGRREKKGSVPFYEVEHEALSEHWSRLLGWLAEARDDRMLVEDLERDAVAYMRDSDPERLWKKGRIGTAIKITSRNYIVLSENATLFLWHARRRERHRGQFIGMLAAVGVALVLGVGWTLARSLATSVELEEAKSELQANAKKFDMLNTELREERAIVREANRRAEAHEKSAEDTQRSMLSIKKESIKNANEERSRAREEIRQVSRTAETKIQEAEEKAQKAVTQAQNAEAKVRDAEGRIQSADARAQSAKAKVRDTEERAQNAEAKAQKAEMKAQSEKAKAGRAAEEARAAEKKLHASEKNMIGTCPRYTASPTSCIVYQ